MTRPSGEKSRECSAAYRSADQKGSPTRNLIFKMIQEGKRRPSIFVISFDRSHAPVRPTAWVRCHKLPVFPIGLLRCPCSHEALSHWLQPCHPESAIQLLFDVTCPVWNLVTLAHDCFENVSKGWRFSLWFPLNSTPKRVPSKHVNFCAVETGQEMGEDGVEGAPWPFEAMGCRLQPLQTSTQGCRSTFKRRRCNLAGDLNLANLAEL